jgi:hypothetical protein
MNVVPRTPADHYATAETLLGHIGVAERNSHEAALVMAARAQIHAALAAVPLHVAEAAHAEWEAEDTAIENRELARITDGIQGLIEALRNAPELPVTTPRIVDMLTHLLAAPDAEALDTELLRLDIAQTIPNP